MLVLDELAVFSAIQKNDLLKGICNYRTGWRRNVLFHNAELRRLLLTRTENARIIEKTFSC